ncbi:MAG: hypothetical protein ACI9UU_002206, partial [Candidatus Azotimanducaceae bacterium]
AVQQFVESSILDKSIVIGLNGSVVHRPSSPGIAWHR